jgi:hypothetical protein
MHACAGQQGSILVSVFEGGLFSFFILAFAVAVLLTLHEFVFELAHNDEELLEGELVLVRIQILQ